MKAKDDKLAQIKVPDERSAQPEKPISSSTSQADSGCELRQLNAAEMKDYGFEGRTIFVVTGIRPGSMAEHAMLQQGDLLFPDERYRVVSIVDMQKLFANPPFTIQTGRKNPISGKVTLEIRNIRK